MAYKRRCSACNIAYPSEQQYGSCLACGANTLHLLGTPDADWEAKVEAILGPQHAVEDPVVRWRYDELAKAGYSPVSALELATRRDVDLHRAVRIASAAGPELAYRIVA